MATECKLLAFFYSRIALAYSVLLGVIAEVHVILGVQDIGWNLIWQKGPSISLFSHYIAQYVCVNAQFPPYLSE